MNKLVAFLKGKLEDRMVDNKVKRVEIALSSAEINFKSQKDDNEIKMVELLKDFNKSEIKVEETIEKISEAMDVVEEAEKGLERIQAIRKYLFSEEED